MPSFLETGYFFFAFLLVVNIQLLAFAPGFDSSLLDNYQGDGITTARGVDLSTLGAKDLTPDPLLTSDSTQKPSSADTASKLEFPDLLGLINSLFFGFAEAIEKSGIPNPINWIFSMVVKIFMSAYLFFTALNIKNLILGGGGSQ